MALAGACAEDQSNVPGAGDGGGQQAGDGSRGDGGAGPQQCAAGPLFAHLAFAKSGLAGWATGDLDGDGRADVVTGSTELSGAGSLMVWLSAKAGGFGLATSYPVAGTPADMVVADLNGDGLRDVALVPDGRSAIAVLFNQGAGQFGKAVEYPLPARPAQVLAADLNGDGRTDLVATASGGAYVLRNAGDRQFLVSRQHAFGDSNRIGFFTLGDLDGDGAPEVISTDTVWFNDGKDASFARSEALPMPQPCDSLAVGDLDGDGDTDVVGATRDGKVTVLDNGGSGTRWTTSTLRSSGQLQRHADGIAITDLDGDGKLDIATTQPAVLLNQGGGRFAPAAAYGAPGEVFDGRLAAADVSGDGLPDLLIEAGSEERVTVWVSQGRGTFAAPSMMADPDTVDSNAQRFLGVVDIDGKGGPEVAVAASTRLTLYALDGPGHFAEAGTYGDQGLSIDAATLGDLDGDGGADVVLGRDGSGTRSVAVWYNKRTGELKPGPVVKMDAIPTSLGIADIDEDGRADIVVGSEFGFGYLAQAQAGQFTQAFVRPDAFNSFGTTVVGVADLNRDRKVDLFGLFRGDVRSLMNDGMGKYPKVANLHTGNASSVVAVDLNGDGAPELVTEGGGVAVLRNLGGGAFSDPEVVATIPHTSGLVAGDFNGDGWPDIAVHATNVALLLNDGKGHLSLDSWYATGLGRITAGDLDADGDLDVVVGYRVLFNHCH